jgi:Glutathione-dependent formaldehyde-activating enzyme
MHVPASSVSSDRDAIDYPACHCRWCQRETGTAHALNALYEADRVGLAAWKFLQRLDDVAVSAALGAVHVLGDPLSSNGYAAVAAAVKVCWRHASLRSDRKGPPDLLQR